MFLSQIRAFNPVRSRVRVRILFHNRLVMDSIPQELIDSIIDNVPKSSLPSCSLVARRWRQKSQQRLLDTLYFPSEDAMNRWCTDIPQDSDGISSYVRHVKIQDIVCWDEPTLFSRMLGNLSSLTGLSLYQTEIPDEFPGHISRGEFGKGITTLHFWFPYCTVATITSIILSLPDLKELSVQAFGLTSEEPLPTYSVTSRREPLHSLELQGNVDEIGEALAKSRFISNCLSLAVHIPDVGQLLMLSSETLVKLELYGV